MGFLTVLVWEAFILEIVNEANDSPLALVLALFSGDVAHHSFDTEGVFDEAAILVEFR